MGLIAFEPVRIHGLDGWLAGLHVPAAPGKPSLLLVPPMPHEWQRGYRLFALLAQALAERGIGSLRFDPTGCGDSSGEDEAFSLAQLETDTRLALAWLRALGDGPILLVGVRAGALVAAPLAQREGLDWIAWQPVLVGAEHLAMLDDREARELRNGRRYGARLPAVAAHSDCLLGHRLHPSMRAQLQAARVEGRARFSVDGLLSGALATWIDEIDLASPFPVPQVRALATALAGQLAGLP